MGQSAHCGINQGSTYTFCRFAALELHQSSLARHYLYKNIGALIRLGACLERGSIIPFLSCAVHIYQIVCGFRSLQAQTLFSTSWCMPGWSSPNPNEFRPSTCHETWEDATVRLQDTRTRTWNWPHRSPLDAVLSDNHNVCHQPISRAVMNVSDPVLQTFLTHGRRRNQYAWVWDGPYVQLELFYLLPYLTAISCRNVLWNLPCVLDSLRRLSRAENLVAGMFRSTLKPSIYSIQHTTLQKNA